MESLIADFFFENEIPTRLAARKGTITVALADIIASAKAKAYGSLDLVLPAFGE